MVLTVSKVCVIGAEITPSNGQVFVGGHVNTVVRLSKGLSSLGWDIHIITTPSRFLREPFSLNLPWAKIHLIKIGSKYNSLKYGATFFSKALKTIKKLHQKESFNLIHSHSGFFNIAVIPFFLKKILRIPALHSLYCPASSFSIGSRLSSYGIRVISNKLDKIIATSNYVKGSLIKYGITKDKINVIPGCIDTTLFNPNVSGMEMRKLLSVNNETRVVLYVGNTKKTKGLDIFLNAAKIVLHKRKKVKFIITLHEPDEMIKHVKTIAPHYLGSHVTVMGVVRNMTSLMASADIVVAPFRSTVNIADYPLTIIEAMAIEKPIIASRVGGIPELLRNNENGILVEPNNPNHLANAIINLLDDSSLRREIGKRAASFIKQNFSCLKVSQRLDNLYREIIRGV